MARPASGYKWYDLATIVLLQHYEADEILETQEILIPAVVAADVCAYLLWGIISS